MATFQVQMDITFSGSIEVTADTEEQAREKAKEISSHFVPSDIRNFYILDTDVVDIENVENI